MAELINQEKALLSGWEENSLIYLNKHNLRPTQTQLPQNLPLAMAVSLFLATLKGQSEETAKTYRVGCRRFMWFIYTTDRGEPDTVTVSSLSQLVLEDFYLWLVDTYGRKARATCGAYLAASRNLFEYLARHRLTPQNCQYQEMIAGLSKLQGRASYKTPRIRGRQVDQVARLALSLGQTPSLTTDQATPDQVVTIEVEESASSEQVQEEDILEADSTSLTTKQRARRAKDPAEAMRQRLEQLRDRAVILTLYTTGMRRQEVASLDRSDLESLIQEYKLLCKVDESKSGDSMPDGQKPALFELIITGKGQKERLVYFDAFTLAVLAEYLELRGKDGYHPLFLQHHRGRNKVKPGPNGEGYRISLVTLWQIVSKYARRLGVEIHPHDFRHNLATTLLNAGAQLSEVQDILGHASPTTTKQIYAHYDKGHLKDAFNKYRKGAEELL